MKWLKRNKESEELIDTEDENIFEKLEENQQPWKMRNKILMAEVICFAFLIAAIFGVRYWKNDPERIAREYVRGMVRGDWNEIYDCLYFGTGDETFLGKKMFVTAQDLGFDKSQVIRTRVTDVTEKKRSENKRKLQITYIKNEETFKTTVFMIKKDGVWYVDGEKEYIRNHVTMKVPKGRKVFFDKKRIDKSLKKATKKKKDIYELPRVFKGLHYITLEKKGMETYEDLIRLE